MNTRLGPFFFAVLCILSSYCITNLYQIHSENRDRKISHFTLLPESLAKAITLEFSGITSDYLMLKTLTYTGEKLIKREPLVQKEWQMVYRALVQITNLDPRFIDPYVMAEMSLPWDANMVDETNVLLEKAAKILTDDYRPNFFLWYNYYHFLDNPEKAGYYLQKAAATPGAPIYFSTLAARMHLFSGKLYAAVIFLQEMIKQTSDPGQLQFLEMRLKAIRMIGFLEQKIQVYKDRFHTSPKHLQDLVDKKIISKIPTDPYGGKFFIMENGRVYTTSKLVFQKTEKE